MENVNEIMRIKHKPYQYICEIFSFHFFTYKIKKMK